MRFAVLRDVAQRCLVVADFSGHPVGPIFKGKAIQDVVTERLPLNIGNYQSMLRNASENLRISSVWPNGYCNARQKRLK
jgi:hypothetical protein